MIENNTNAIAVPNDIKALSDAELMKLTGQLDNGGTEGSVLSRLTINYQTEDENDNPLPRGQLMVMAYTLKLLLLDHSYECLHIVIGIIMMRFLHQVCKDRH